MKMERNHEYWRNNWMIDIDNGLAFHRSGIVAELKQNEVIIENTVSIKKINKKYINKLNLNNLKREAEILLLNK